MPNVKLRTQTPSDLPFLKNSWLTSYRKNGYGVAIMAGPAYYRAYSGRIEAFLGHPGAIVRLAVKQDEPKVIFGWVAAAALKPDGFTLGFVYVKADFRKMGIATELLKGLDVFEYACYCDTPAGKAIREKLRPARYNPFGLLDLMGEKTHEVRNNGSGSDEREPEGNSFDFRPSAENSI